MPKGNVPRQFTQEGQDERDWRKNKTRAGDNYTYAAFNKEKYRSNYDEIDWSKK